MDNQRQIDFQRISKAIEYINTHFREQPSLNEIAEYVNMSPYHFQRMFKDWAGVSPKKFLQYISIEYAKRLINKQGIKLSEAAFLTGLSGTSRLHDMFVKIEGMTPAEYKNGGKSLIIKYSFEKSPFGNLIIASTDKGVCHMAFENDREKAFEGLVTRFEKACFQQQKENYHEDIIAIFEKRDKDPKEIKLHIKGTEFQLKVWESLLKIPRGRLSTYGEIAGAIGKPTASRAVGNAIGNNPIAYLIPCHRVIQASGALGGYMWGESRKTAIIGWEMAATEEGVI